jgi:rare lipoprotein A
LAAGAGALVIPGLAFAGPGGLGGSGGAGTGPQSAPTVPVSDGNVPVSASSDGITITSEASAFMRGGVSVTGTVPGSDSGDTVELDQLGSGTAATWTPVADTTAASNGTFSATWHPRRPGPVTIRALIQGSQASSAAAAPTVSVTLYRRSTATLYGPGFYGHRTACGRILGRTTIGVANRTLKCGTPVQIYYKGQVITVPVIDRGPYAHGANWDLTMATGRAIGMLETEVIGAAPVPSATGSAASGMAMTQSVQVPGAQ